MKLQDKADEFLNQAARENGYKDRVEYTKKAMIAFASYCCERQRESDAEAATWDAPLASLLLNQDGDYVVKQTDISVDKSSILNNKLITDELTEK